MINDNQNKILVQRLKSGDPEAFGILYSHCKGDAYRVAYRMTSNHVDTEDVLMSASQYALENITIFNPSQSFKAWFFRIVKKEARKLCKIRKKDEKIKKAVRETEPLYSDDGEVTNGIVKEENKYILSEIFKRLPRRVRRILTDAFVEGMDYNDMAKKYHCSIQNVYYMIDTARQKARKIAKIQKIFYP
jgi:RNA polymerase sigma-70 factor (ECF subfamily)